MFFIDPPYTAGGKRAGSRLYTHSELDHEKLFSHCEKLRGDFLMTYDNAEEVQALAERHGFETKPVAMKNTHHAEMDELLIGRNLDWVEDGGIFREEPPTYKVAQATKKARRAKLGDSFCPKRPSENENRKRSPDHFELRIANCGERDPSVSA